MRTLYVLTVSFIFVFIFNSCKEKCYDKANPDCENYDPCDGKTRINSNFRVRPGDRGFKPPEQWCDLIPCDTFASSSVRFDVPLNNPSNSSYAWQIGTELTQRTGKGFEIDFSGYLNKGKWETYIPVTLTIKTPFNSCLTHPEDTLITVTRQLFFTQKQMSLYRKGESVATFKGYFTNEPGKEILLTFIDINKGYFRGESAPFTLIVGLPFADTLLSPITNQFEGCYNYRHSKLRILFPGENTPSLSYYMSYVENYFYNENKLMKILEFAKPSGTENYKFIGERL